MTLKIQTEQDEQRQLKMTIEVPEERVQQQMRRTARKLAREINLPGFRRGKAPYNVIVSRVGRDTLRAEAIEEMIQPVFEEALDEVEPEIYAQANFDDMELEPFVLTFTIPLTPEVTLGDYRSLRKDIEPATVTDEALEDALERVRTRHQVLEEVSRPAEAGDLVTISGKGELISAPDDEEEAPEEIEEPETADETDADEALSEEEADEILAEANQSVIFNEERLDVIMDSEKAFAGTDFVDNVIGMSTGEEKTFTITFPEDFEDEELARKEAEFTISVLNVQSRDVPELTDELAKEEGDYETVEDLKEALQEQLLEQAEAEAKNELIEDMIDDLLEDATIVYPPAAVEQEIDDMIENYKNQALRSGWQWEDFLKLQGLQEEDIREDFRDAAAERLSRQLALRQFIFDEKLRIQEEDVEAMIDERVGMFGDNQELADSMRDYYRSGPGFDMLSSEVLMDKAYERMKAILSGEAPDLDELEEAEAEVDETEAADAPETEEQSEEETAVSQPEATEAEAEIDQPESEAEEAAAEESEKSEPE